MNFITAYLPPDPDRLRELNGVAPPPACVVSLCPGLETRGNRVPFKRQPARNIPSTEANTGDVWGCTHTEWTKEKRRALPISGATGRRLIAEERRDLVWGYSLLAEVKRDFSVEREMGQEDRLRRVVDF